MSDSLRLVVLGDSLLDRDVEGEVRRVCPDSPAPVLEESEATTRPGGAALAAALASALARQDGVAVTLVTAVCDDPAGQELRQLVKSAGVQLVALPAAGRTPEKVRLRAGGQTLLRLDRGDSGSEIGPLPRELPELLEEAAAVLVADYGRGITASATVRRALEECGRPVVWDPHPRGADPVAGCRLVTPNGSEVLARWAPDTAGDSMADLTAAARRGLRSIGAAGVAVTRGDQGVLLVSDDGPPLAVPVLDRHDGDTCGAGDCFAASAAVQLARGALPSEAVTRAVADASAFVRAGGAAAYPRCLPSASERAVGPTTSASAVVERTRASGGTVVAAGGCFDLLHAGHVSMLRSARSLGDCLVVCLNSDRSVSRLKGPDRPVNHQHDRAATLVALDCVDAVAVFDEDTPEEIIRALRPDVWVKGGDYDARTIPEAATLAEWGGQAVVLPYLPGRSTTGILARASTPGR